MNARTQISMDPETQRRAHEKAAVLGISFAEYVRRLVADDLATRVNTQDVSLVFNIVQGGAPTDIARDKDKMVGEAVWKEYVRKTVPRRAAKAEPKAKRR